MCLSGPACAVPEAFLGAQPGAVELWAGVLLLGVGALVLGRRWWRASMSLAGGRAVRCAGRGTTRSRSCSGRCGLRRVPVLLVPVMEPCQPGRRFRRGVNPGQAPSQPPQCLARLGPGAAGQVGADVALDMDQAALHRGFGPTLLQCRCEHPSYPKLPKHSHPEIRPPTLGSKPSNTHVLSYNPSSVVKQGLQDKTCVNSWAVSCPARDRLLSDIGFEWTNCGPADSRDRQLGRRE